MSDDVNRRTVFPVRNICRGGPGKWVYDDRDPLQDDTHALMPWKEYERLTDELADALKNESHYAKEIIEKDKRIEELKLEMGQWVRAMGLLTTMKPDLKIDAEHPGLMAREIFKWVAEKEDQIRNMDFDISHLQNECSEKDKRIGELEQDRERGLEERGYHIITTDQIDAAWSDAWRKYQGTNSTAGFSSLEKVGIVACGGCGGSGKAEYPLEGNYGPCPSCHGHGWKKT